MGKRQELRERRQKQQTSQRILMIVGVAFVALALALVFILPNLPQDPGEIVVPEFFDRPQADNNATGDPNAPIRIEGYSDYQCIHCRDFYVEKEREFLARWVETGQVYFVYKTVAYGDGESLRAGEAAYCAGDQGKFWEMHDIIFANWQTPNTGGFSDVRLKAFAENLGLDKATFDSCLNSNKYSSQVQTVTTVDTQKAGVRATPSFVLFYTVNGEEKTKLLEGNQPFSAFEQAINEALAEMGK